MSHRVAVMYLRKIVEIAPAQAIYQNPCHPYTKALLSVIPVPDPTHISKRIILQGDVPNSITPPTGCHFHSRCWKATVVCQTTYSPLTQRNKNHTFCCYHPLHAEAIT
jgi:oligopeptide/dipeptide ABC transporter ATP-binding protein